MNIKKIQLVGSGFKGCSVTYLRQEEKNGRPFVNEVIEKRKHPIHLSLETMFKDLRFYLVDIAGLLRGDEDKMTKDYTIQETEVVSIDFDSESFTIGGEKQVFLNKKIKLKTCKVDSIDNYEHFETVQKLIQSIVEETKEYLAGTKKVDDIEVAVRWVQSGKAKGITEDTLKDYTPEQLLEFSKRLIENQFGGIVLLAEDMNVGEIDVSEANAEIQKAEEESILISETEDVSEVEVLNNEDVFIPIPIKADKKVKKELAAKIMGNTLVQEDVQKEEIIKPAF